MLHAKPVWGEAAKGADAKAVLLWAKAAEGALAERELSRLTCAELRSSFAAHLDRSMRVMRQRHRAMLRRFRLKHKSGRKEKKRSCR